MINENEARILSDGFRIYNDDGSSDVYDIIPPSPSLNHRGGIIADTKTDDDTVEIKIGEDGKGYVPTYPVIIDALSKTNVEEYIPTEDYHPATKQYVDESIEAIPRDVFIVNASYDSYEEEFTVFDKTYEEIKEALDNGFVVLVNCNGRYYHYSETSLCDGYPMYFISIQYTDYTILLETIILSRDNVASYSFNTLVTKETRFSDLHTNSNKIIGAINELNIEIDEKQDKNLIVTVTSSTDDEGIITYNSDKTITEIYEAYSNGKSVYLVYNNGIYNLTNITSSSVLFFRHQNANYEFFTITSSKIIYNGDYLQKTSDSSLTTEDTSIVGAINEVNTHVTNAENRLEVLEQTQSDWNQNDETAKDYVNNRICYTKDPITVTILDEQELELTYDEAYGDYSALNVATISDENIEYYKKADTLTVVWNDVEYELSYSYVYAKNGNAIFGDDTYVNYPFALYITNHVISVYTKDSTAKIKITINYIETIQLDEKYISYKPGMKMKKSTTYTIDNTEYYPSSGAEIFNDYKNNIAIGAYSHVSGRYNTAIGDYSHAEGLGTTASGSYSHAEGQGARAASENQHVQGIFNIEDADGIYAHIIGNGSSNTNRSNAHTVDWSGNAEYKGDVLANACGGENPISLVNVYNKLVELITLLTVSEEDNGKTLQVVNGAWIKTYYPTAEEIADIVMSKYVETIDSINGETVYNIDILSNDLDMINGEVI